MNVQLSVIVPVYNMEKYLDICMSSLVNQTYKNIEIIVVDDGSTDNTKKILKEYTNKKNIKLLFKQKEGVSISRNTGIKISTGDYITFLDADDWLEYNTIEKIVNCKEDMNVDIVRYNYYINYNEIEQTEINMKIDSKDKNCKLKINNKIINYFINGSIEGYVWLLLIERSSIPSFDSSISLMEDFIFILELIRNAKTICFFDKCLYHHYSNQDGISRTTHNIEDRINDIVEVTTKANKILLSYKDNNIDIEKFNLQQANLIYIFFFRIIDNNKSKDINLEKIVWESLIKFINSIDLKKIGIKRKIALILIKKQKFKVLKYYIGILKKLKKYKDC